MSFRVALNLSENPKAFVQAVDMAWNELQWHTEVCEEPDHAAECDAALDLLSELRDQLDKPEAAW